MPSPDGLETLFDGYPVDSSQTRTCPTHGSTAYLVTGGIANDTAPSAVEKWWICSFDGELLPQVRGQIAGPAGRKARGGEQR
jgi:hypothetical protein